jgi:orotate phosphoribosyltransferase
MSPVITGILAIELKKDILIIKEKKLDHGLENIIYGNINGEVILIDDVSSTGTILVNAAIELRKNGAIVRYALLSACRDNTALDNLKKANIKPLYIATYEEIINELWDSLT